MTLDHEKKCAIFEESLHAGKFLKKYGSYVRIATWEEVKPMTDALRDKFGGSPDRSEPPAIILKRCPYCGDHLPQPDLPRFP